MYLLLDPSVIWISLSYAPVPLVPEVSEVTHKPLDAVALVEPLVAPNVRVIPLVSSGR